MLEKVRRRRRRLDVEGGSAGEDEGGEVRRGLELGLVLAVHVHVASEGLRAGEASLAEGATEGASTSGRALVLGGGEVFRRFAGLRKVVVAGRRW